MSEFTLCEDTAMLAVDGACPAHGGDACLRQYAPRRTIKYSDLGKVPEGFSYDPIAQAKALCDEPTGALSAAEAAVLRASLRALLAEAERQAERIRFLESGADGAQPASLSLLREDGVRMSSEAAMTDAIARAKADQERNRNTGLLTISVFKTDFDALIAEAERLRRALDNALGCSEVRAAIATDGRNHRDDRLRALEAELAGTTSLHRIALGNVERLEAENAELRHKLTVAQSRLVATEIL